MIIRYWATNFNDTHPTMTTYDIKTYQNQCRICHTCFSKEAATSYQTNKTQDTTLFPPNNTDRASENVSQINWQPCKLAAWQEAPFRSALYNQGFYGSDCNLFREVKTYLYRGQDIHSLSTSKRSQYPFYIPILLKGFGAQGILSHLLAWYLGNSGR